MSQTLKNSERDSPADRLDTLPPEIPELTLGWHVARWIEGTLRQPNGPSAGKPFKLTPRQLRFILHWYGVDAAGRWLYHHGVRRLAKGSGKSPFAAVLALAEFCAPVRVYDIDESADNPMKRVIGKPVDLPLVQIAATSETQTANTMRMVRAIAHKGSRVVTKYGLDPGKTKFYKLPEGTLEVITSSATAAEGAEASFNVMDETEHWTPSNGGPELMSTLNDNLAKSGSRALETANAWVPGFSSVAEISFDAWVAQEEGRTKSNSKILYDAVIAPPDTDMGDPASLRAALEHVYADCAWTDIDAIMARIWDPRSRPADSQRKYFNRPTAIDSAWVTREQWAQCVPTEETPALEDGQEIVAFFDGSRADDATALVGCRVSDGYTFLVGAWEKPHGPAGEGWEVPAREVDECVAWMFGKWSVKAFFADVREFESFVHVRWPEEHGSHLELWAKPSGRTAAPIAWDMRAHTMEFTRAVEACRDEILQRDLIHDGSAVIARHIFNARTRRNSFGESISKESPDSSKKIDAAVCVIGARMVRRMLLTERDKNSESNRPRKRAGRVKGWR